MMEEKYTYLSNKWKKDFAHLALARGAKLSTEEIEDWNFSNELGLLFYQLDDLMYVPKETLLEWSKL